MAHRAPRPPRGNHPRTAGLGCLLVPGAAILLATATLFTAALLMH